MAARNFRPKVKSPVELHRSWLELVETDGPFLAAPVLAKEFNSGIRPAYFDEVSHRDAYKAAQKKFEDAWEALDSSQVTDADVKRYQLARDEWVRFVLENVADWSDDLVWVPELQETILAYSPNRSVATGARAYLPKFQGSGYSALVSVVRPTGSLREVPGDSWGADYIDRMDALLRENQCQLGIVTDGRWWALVCARPGAMTASGVFDALTFGEETHVRDALFALLEAEGLETYLPSLFEQSVAAAEEVTEALGAQVRRAVELLIQSFSESATQAQLNGGVTVLPEKPSEAYEAAVMVMMRVVFLLFAEERSLLPTGLLFEQGYGISQELEELERREKFEGEEVLDATSLTWHRLLATSRALYEGSTFEDMRIPAYGGSLFDPARFPFLRALDEHGLLKLAVSDRVMLHVLRSVQYAVIGSSKDARRISFRDIDVEQIGYIYEGLLGYTVDYSGELTLGLEGKEGVEPEITLAKLESLAQKHPVESEPKAFADELLAFLKQDQPSARARSKAQILKALKAAPEDASVRALRQLLGQDNPLVERIAPWLPLIRSDLRRKPFVVAEGGLLVKETPSRKNAGAHYTPKSLAEEVVLHALQPLCYSPGPHQSNNPEDWKLKKSYELTQLKVADIACGSGAFLVAAARYLSERLAEAWVLEDSSRAGEKHLRDRAMREVVAKCLYGADINPMAVEMCKLSLWLVSLDPKLPFSFVDDKIFLGNSLLGLTDLKQIGRAHIDPSVAPQDALFSSFDGDSQIRQAIELRRQLASQVDESDPTRSLQHKKFLLDQYRQVTGQLRTIADGVVAAGLALGGKPGKKLDEAYENLRIALQQAFAPAKGAEPDDQMLEAITARGLTPSVETDYERWQPLHWVLEAPDVMVDRGGFDAIIGNPPFLGSQKLKGAMGTNMRDWFVEQIGFGAKGIADFVAYFFLRAQTLLNQRGTLGLIATNTLAQGDTREVGLGQMLEKGFAITRSIQSKKWPSASANLEYAAVWGSMQDIADEIHLFADGVQTRKISSLLEPAGAVLGDPFPLDKNSQVAFNGIYVLGMGFTLEISEALKWIEEEPTLAEVVRPYLGGKDLNTNPDNSASRYVIDFNDRSEEEAKKYARAYEQVKELVKPERQRTKNGKYVLRKPLPEKWWQYSEKRPAMRQAIANKERVIVIAQVSSTLMPALVEADQVLDAMLIVFALDDYASFAVLSSDFHRFWAIQNGTTMRTDARYTPSTIFGTFPRPVPTDATEEWGRVLDEERREIMLRRQLGLTKLYNLVNDPELADSFDPDVARLRQIHRKIDQAVAQAYGWEDISLDHGFYTYKQVTRYSISPAARLEILDRLLAENHRRAQAQTRADGTSKSAPKTSKRTAKAAQSKQEESLF